MTLQVSIGEAIRAVALGDPLSTVLLVIGVVLTGFALGVFGLLSFGAAVDFLTRV